MVANVLIVCVCVHVQNLYNEAWGPRIFGAPCFKPRAHFVKIVWWLVCKEITDGHLHGHLLGASHPQSEDLPQKGEHISPKKTAVYGE